LSKTRCRIVSIDRSDTFDTWRKRERKQKLEMIFFIWWKTTSVAKQQTLEMAMIDWKENFPIVFQMANMNVSKSLDIDQWDQAILRAKTTLIKPYSKVDNYRIKDLWKQFSFYYNSAYIVYRRRSTSTNTEWTLYDSYGWTNPKYRSFSKSFVFRSIEIASCCCIIIINNNRSSFPSTMYWCSTYEPSTCWWFSW